MPQGAARMEMLLLAAYYLVSKRIHALWGSKGRSRLQPAGAILAKAMTAGSALRPQW